MSAATQTSVQKLAYGRHNVKTRDLLASLLLFATSPSFTIVTVEAGISIIVTVLGCKLPFVVLPTLE